MEIRIQTKPILPFMLTSKVSVVHEFDFPILKVLFQPKISNLQQETTTLKKSLKEECWIGAIRIEVHKSNMGNKLVRYKICHIPKLSTCDRSLKIRGCTLTKKKKQVTPFVLKLITFLCTQRPTHSYDFFQNGISWPFSIFHLSSSLPTNANYN